jgi:hypothetical protein
MKRFSGYIVFFNKEDFNACYDAENRRLDGTPLVGPLPKDFPCCFEYYPPFSAQFSGDYEEIPIEEVINYVEENIIFWNNLKNLLTND